MAIANRKPSIERAQEMPFFSLFKTCARDMGKQYSKVVAGLLALSAAVYLLLTFGPRLWNAITAGFWAVVGFLHLGAIVEGLFSAIAWLVTSISMLAETSVTGSYHLMKSWLPGVLEFTLITCRDVTNKVEGKDLVSQVCDGSWVLHYPANGVAIGVILMWVIMLIFTVLLFIAQVIQWWKGYRSSLNDYKEGLYFLVVMMVGLFVASTVGSVLTGVTHGFAAPILKQSFGSPVEYSKMGWASLLMMLFIFCLPAIVLQEVMKYHLRTAREQAKHDNMSLPIQLGYRSSLDQDVNILLREPSRMVVYRSLAVAAGAVAFLSMVRLGTTLWPSGYGLAVACVVAFGVVAISLACVVTCYPSLRVGYAELKKAREKAIADDAAERSVQEAKQRADEAQSAARRHRDTMLD